MNIELSDHEIKLIRTILVNYQMLAALVYNFPEGDAEQNALRHKESLLAIMRLYIKISPDSAKSGQSESI